MTPTDTAPVELTLPDAPAIPGLRFRRFRDASDWAPLADLQKAVAIADKDDEIQSPENLRIEVENKPAFRIDRDLLIAEVDGRVIGSADGTATIRDGYPVHSLSGGGSIPTGDGAGSAGRLFRWNERRARERAAAESRVRRPSRDPRQRGRASSNPAPRPCTPPRATRSSATRSR